MAGNIPATSFEREPSLVTGDEDTSYFFGPSTPMPAGGSVNLSGAPHSSAIPDRDNEEAVSDDLVQQDRRDGFVFYKGRNDKGQPYVTVYRPVTTATFQVAVPDNDRRHASEILTAFIDKAVTGALVYNEDFIKVATSTSMISIPRGSARGGSRDILWKPIWRDRVKKIAPMLGLDLGSIYDGAGASGSGRDPAKYGNYHSSHVEKKLATFALYSMLEEYGIPTERYPTLTQIRRLREAIQQGECSHRPGFDIVISRKYCSLCLAYVKLLGRASGIRFTLKVRHIVHQKPLPTSTTLAPDCVTPPSTGSRNVSENGQRGERFTEAELAEDNGPVVEEDEARDDGKTPPPPTVEAVQQFSERLQTYTLPGARRIVKRSREPLFKRKPLPPTAEIRTSVTSPHSRAHGHY